MNYLILIKYGELTTKKGNRKMFIKTLQKNIKESLVDVESRITYNNVRMYIETNDADLVSEKLKKVFGIHEFVICYKTTNNIDEIKHKVFEILKTKTFTTFKVVTNRADKTFEIASMDFNRLMGGHILKNFDCKVDVHNPNIYVNIEIRAEGTFIYFNEEKGAGGYPVGVQGKGLMMLSGGIDSPVALYLSLKRGISIDAIYFDSPPHTSIEVTNKVKKLTNILKDYNQNIKLHIVPFTKLQEEIYKNVDNDYVITIMRRMMYRIAEEFALKNKYKIILNGESIGQVASQTLDSMVVINEVVNIPVIRPLACLDKLEIIEIAKKIGTYETSILPYDDCCTVFVPVHPVINPNLAKCIDNESKFDYKHLVKECVDNIITVNNSKNNFSDLL